MSEKILIIDNDPEMVTLLSMLIREKTPYKIEVTNNPLEALELIGQDAFTLVITEMKMPVLDGFELLEEFRRTGTDIPVIIMASSGNSELALEARHNGAFDFIIKPFRKEHVLFAIENALDSARLKKENERLKEQLLVTIP